VNNNGQQKIIDCAGEKNDRGGVLFFDGCNDGTNLLFNDH